MTKAMSLREAAAVIFVLVAVLPLMLFVAFLSVSDLITKTEAQFAALMAVIIACLGFVVFRRLVDQIARLAREVNLPVLADEPLPEDLLLDTVAFRRELEDTFEEARSKLAGGPPPPLSAVRQKLVVAVIGGGLEDPVGEEQAHAVGVALARAGTHLVCGGLGGCMAAAARGYREGSGEGIVLGILPGASRHEANPWIDLPIPTGVGDAQSALVAMAVDGAIVVGGGGGTLSEIGLLLRDGKPVVALPHTGGAAEMVGGRKLYKHEVVAASSPDEAVMKLLRALSERPNLAKR